MWHVKDFDREEIIGMDRRLRFVAMRKKSMRSGLTWASASVYGCWSLLLLIERQIRLSVPKYILLLFISQYWLSMLYFWNVSSPSATHRYSPAGSDLIFSGIRFLSIKTIFNTIKIDQEFWNPFLNKSRSIPIFFVLNYPKVLLLVLKGIIKIVFYTSWFHSVPYQYIVPWYDLYSAIITKVGA